jgi:hypothetical protein
MGVGRKLLLLRPMSPTKSQFDAIHTGRADPSRYLIIGFDTVYQRNADGDARTTETEIINPIIMYLLSSPGNNQAIKYRKKLDYD